MRSSTRDHYPQYGAILLRNTCGSAILDADQRANFENWLANGGHVQGIHAASGTYRHSTANGSSTGVRDYYAEPIGASVQENPNPVIGAPATSTTVPNKRVIPAVGVFMHGDAGGASSSFLQLQSMSAMMASNAMMACAQRGVPIASIRLS